MYVCVRSACSAEAPLDDMATLRGLNRPPHPSHVSSTARITSFSEAIFPQQGVGKRFRPSDGPIFHHCLASYRITCLLLFVFARCLSVYCLLFLLVLHFRRILHISSTQSGYTCSTHRSHTTDVVCPHHILLNPTGNYRQVQKKD